MNCSSLATRSSRGWWRCARLVIAGLSVMLAALTSSNRAQAVTSLTITGVETTCGTHHVKFTRGGSIQSGEIFELWRTSGGVMVMVAASAATSASQLTDVNFVPGTNETLTYQIRASRPGALVISNSVNVVASRAKCGIPSVLRARVLRVSCPQAGTPLPLDIHSLIFDDSSGAASISNYFFDASAGQTSFEGEDEGLSRVLSSGAQCGERFDQAQGRWFGFVPQATRTEIKAILTELNRDAKGKPDRWIVILDRAVNGDEGTVADGVRGVFIGGGKIHDDHTLGQRGILHELGHSYGAHHSGTISCSSTPFAKNFKIDATCSSTPSDAVDPYGDAHDPMGAGGYQFSAFNKYVFGWIPESDVVTVSLPEKRAVSTDVTLRDAGWTDGPRLIKVAYGTAQGTEYFFLEYRRALGFNAPGLLGMDEYPVSASVYIRYFPTRALTCGATSRCLPVDRDASVWLPYTAAGGSRWLIRADQDPYWDPYRKIRITMLSRSGRNTTLRIEHEAQ